MAPITARPGPRSAPEPGAPTAGGGPPVRSVPPLLHTRARPVSAAAERAVTLPVDLGALFPGGAARRGTVVHVAPASPATGGTTSLAVALLAAVSRAGGWGAVVGLSDPGVAAIADAGAELDRLVFVPEPGVHWAEVTATALTGTDVVLTRPPARVPPRVARRLALIARERRSVLIVAAPLQWPEPPDVRLVIRRATWTGLGHGHGHLHARRCDVVAEGRRAASRPVEVTLWLPSRGSLRSPDNGDGPAGTR